MESEHDAVRWLDAREMHAWRSYVVTTLVLRQRLHRDLTDAHDVSLVDYEVLVCLSEQPGARMRMTELAAMLGSAKSRLSHQIGRLEREGNVRRLPDGTDKRGVVAELSGQGRALLRGAAPTHVEGVRRYLIDLLSPAEQELLGTVFSRVHTHLADTEE